jgi:hypothetical protein
MRRQFFELTLFGVGGAEMMIPLLVQRLRVRAAQGAGDFVGDAPPPFGRSLHFATTKPDALICISLHMIVASHGA